MEKTEARMHVNPCITFSPCLRKKTNENNPVIKIIDVDLAVHFLGFPSNGVDADFKGNNFLLTSLVQWQSGKRNPNGHESCISKMWIGSREPLKDTLN